MPPTDGFDELALIRFRGECGWSSSTATSASRPSRIGADRRSVMRCVSNVRALCRAAPIARRNTESAGARTCSSRSQARDRASSEAVRSSRNASSSRNRASRSPAAGSKSAQTQVLADALLMLRDRLPPAGVGVDRLGVGRPVCRAANRRISPSISRGVCWGNRPSTRTKATWYAKPNRLWGPRRRAISRRSASRKVASRTKRGRETSGSETGTALSERNGRSNQTLQQHGT